MSGVEAFQPWMGLIGGLIGVGVAVATYFRGVIQQNQKIATIETATNDRIHNVELKTNKIESITNERIQVAELSAIRIEEATASRLHLLELDLNTVKTQFNVFWAVIEKELPKILIRPHTPEIDRLLRKMPHEELTEDEKKELIARMREEINKGLSEEDSARALGYTFVIARLESKRAVSTSSTTTSSTSSTTTDTTTTTNTTTTTDSDKDSSGSGSSNTTRSDSKGVGERGGGWWKRQ